MNINPSQPIHIDRESSEAFQTQLVRQLQQRIMSGQLQAGDTLPSINTLIRLTHVSKNTVLGAFEKLTDAGLIHAQKGKGFFVSVVHNLSPHLQTQPLSPDIQPKPTPANPACKSSGVYVDPPAAPVRYDFTPGRPSPHAFPHRQWNRLSSLLLRSGLPMTEYPPAEGLWGLRMHISDYLAVTRAIHAEPEQIIIVAGIQEALSLLAAHFLDSTSHVVVESPCYSGFYNLLELHRSHIHAIPVDEQGLMTDALPDCPTQLAYVTPAHQYPLGHVMSLQRRKALLQWAASSGAYIIEDDYDSEFYYQDAPLPSLMQLDARSVIHTGTFSKVLGPGLRLGYMVCPQALVAPISRRKALLNNGCPILDQAIMSRFLENGSYMRHAIWLRRKYLEQRNTLMTGLRRIWGHKPIIYGHDSGMHITVRLPESAPPATQVVDKALRYGVRLYALNESACSVGHGQTFDERSLLFGYAKLECEHIEDALSRLAMCHIPGLN